MKFIISSKTLSSQLQAIGRVINAKNSLPILESFLFDIKDGVLTLTASDSETTLTSTLALPENDGEGRFAIKSKTMLDALKDVPEQPLTFEVNTNTLEVIILYQNGKYSLVAQRADEYPQAIALGDNIVSLNMQSNTLLSGINRSLFAVSDDTLRPVMNGIYFDITPESVTIVATDGHKLVRSRNLSNHGDEKAAFVLPKKPAQMLKSLLNKEEEEVQIRFDGRNAIFQATTFVMVCRLIEGRFPNYNAVIPQGNPFCITIDRAVLLSALKRVLVFSTEGAWLVKLTLSPNELTVSGQDLDFSTSAEEHLTCSYNGQPMSIGFKGTFLADILNNLSGQDVQIELADPSRPGVLVPVEQEENEDVLMLLMPMMLND